MGLARRASRFRGARCRGARCRGARCQAPGSPKVPGSWQPGSWQPGSWQPEFARAPHPEADRACQPYGWRVPGVGLARRASRFRGARCRGARCPAPGRPSLLGLRIPRLTGPVSPTAGGFPAWGWHAVPAVSEVQGAENQGARCKVPGSWQSEFARAPHPEADRACQPYGWRVPGVGLARRASRFRGARCRGARCPAPGSPRRGEGLGDRAWFRLWPVRWRGVLIAGVLDAVYTGASRTVRAVRTAALPGPTPYPLTPLLGGPPPTPGCKVPGCKVPAARGEATLAADGEGLAAFSRAVRGSLAAREPGGARNRFEGRPGVRESDRWATLPMFPLHDLVDFLDPDA